jgi:hypothetical protein
MEIDINNKKVLKCLKSYLVAKKYYDNDTEKSYEYFKQCISILNNLKNNNTTFTTNLNDIIEETETECSKYINKTITTIIDKPQLKQIHTDNILFTFIESGDIGKIKKYKYGNIDFTIVNEHGLTPTHYAIKCGDITFLKYLFKLGAKLDQTNKNGHTLLEYACLEKDPNMINFLIEYGASMEKHLLFREGKQYFNKTDQIDIALLLKIILNSTKIVTDYKIKYLDFLFNYFKPDELIDIKYNNHNNNTLTIIDITFLEFIIKLDIMIEEIDKDSRETYISIIKDELSYDLIYKLGCPDNKIDILLYNLVPFININFDLKLNWLISLEIKYLIIKILKNNNKINITELKKELFNLLYNIYVKTNLISPGIIYTLVIQWIYKINV